MRPTQIAVANANVHLRQGPGTNYSTVAALPLLATGSVVSVLHPDPGNGWTQVQDAFTAAIGYSATKYLDIHPAAQPIFLPDVFWRDANGKPQWDRLFLDPRNAGAILKVSQGTSTSSGETAWFTAEWPALKAAGGDAYGQSWFRGAYHFLMLNLPEGQTAQAFGQAQADFYLRTLASAGGLTSLDLPPIVDVENSTASGGQHDPSVVEAIATAWAERVQSALGRKPMIYRRYSDSDWPGLKSRMGCSYLWAKRYHNTLGTIDNGFSSAAFWQYTDGTSNITDLPPQEGGLKYPYELPGIGPSDASTVLFEDGGAADVRALIAGIVGSPPLA